MLVRKSKTCGAQCYESNANQTHGPPPGSPLHIIIQPIIVTQPLNTPRGPKQTE